MGIPQRALKIDALFLYNKKGGDFMADTKGYPNLYEATGYGTGDGLCGW
jgi:hypothetical protein